MPALTLRPQKISDARRFFEILKSPDFPFLQVSIESLEDEKLYLRENRRLWKKGLEYNYTILLDGKVVGACGLRLNRYRKGVGEIGYFVDPAFWGQGIASGAVKQLERIGFEELGLFRLVIRMDVRNLASERVAEKCGYLKEGTLRKAVFIGGSFCDCYLYAKMALSGPESENLGPENLEKVPAGREALKEPEQLKEAAPIPGNHQVV